MVRVDRVGVFRHPALLYIVPNVEFTLAQGLRAPTSTEARTHTQVTEPAIKKIPAGGGSRYIFKYLKACWFCLITV